MYAGKIVEQAQAKKLFGAGGTVRMRYTRALLDAIPHIDRAAHTQLPVVSGRPPDPTALPAGCSFAPRCAHAADDCLAKSPALAEHSPGHSWACWHPCENGVSA
jgi:oligopeptide/dipeptide ABC transporter ATP-binding protein